MDAEQLNQEFENEYHPIYIELKKLEFEFPRVAANQLVVVNDDNAIMINTYAALLHAAQETKLGEESTPGEVRRGLQALAHVVGFRDAISDLVEMLFPATVIIIEKLYFQNRAAERYFSIPASERPDEIKYVDPSEWWYPNERIEELRDLARAIWRDHVSEATEDKASVSDLRSENLGG